VNDSYTFLLAVLLIDEEGVGQSLHHFSKVDKAKKNKPKIKPVHRR
jgi:hypothetical protein